MCIDKKHYSGIIASAAAFALISLIVYTLSSFLSMGYYTDPANSQIWSKIMMPVQGPPPAIFFIFSIAVSLLSGALFAGAYSLVIKSIPGSGIVSKGLNYGIFLFLVSGLPGALGMWLLLNVPSGLLVVWTIENLVVTLLGAMAMAKMIK